MSKKLYTYCADCDREIWVGEICFESGNQTFCSDCISAIDSRTQLKLKVKDLEKRIPKYPVNGRKAYTIMPSTGQTEFRMSKLCPNGHNLPVVVRDNKMPFCPMCGQSINWDNFEF